MISLPQYVIDGLEGGRFGVRRMLKAYLTSGTYGLWNGAYDASLDGVTYKPLASNMDVDLIPGSGDMRADQVTITLSALSTDALAMMQDGEWHQRQAVVYEAYVDDADMIAHAAPVFAGFIDQAVHTDRAGDISTLVITLESSNRELDRASGRLNSDSDQRQHGDATDTFFVQAPTSTANTDIYWGQASPS